MIIMQTLFVLLFSWAEDSVGMKIMAVLAMIAGFVLLMGPGSYVLNKVTGRFELVSGWMDEVGCLTKLIIVVVCVAIILLFLQLDGNYVFWEP